MRMAMIGLGKMGGNMVRRLRRSGIEVVGYDRAAEAVAQLAAEEGMVAASSVEDAVAQLSSPRVVWLMLPSGEPTEQQVRALVPLLSRGDIIVDGGNSNYHDSQRRGAWLAEQGIGFMDSGTSGGIWGLENGYCLMVGGDCRSGENHDPHSAGAGSGCRPRLGACRPGRCGTLHQDDPQRHRVRHDAVHCRRAGVAARQAGICARSGADHRAVAAQLGGAQLAARPYCGSPEA